MLRAARGTALVFRAGLREKGSESPSDEGRIRMRSSNASARPGDESEANASREMRIGLLVFGTTRSYERAFTFVRVIRPIIPGEIYAVRLDKVLIEWV